MNDMSPMVASNSTAQMPAQMGFGSVAGFELLTRIARAISQSSLVPVPFQSHITKYNRDGTIKSQVENPQGLPNCMVALNMAHRLGDDPLMVMQNLDVIEGRPSWSAKWIIAKINASGRFHPLRFDLVDRGQRTVTMTYFEWENQQRFERTREVVVHDQQMICWTLPISEPPPPRTLAQALEMELAVLKSAPVSIEMAVKEGWYTKAGSKWQTMPDLMLHYRSAAFFGRIYAPDLLLGLITSEEARDIIASRQVDGTFAVDEDGVVAGAVPTTAAERARAALRPEPAQPEPADKAPVEAAVAVPDAKTPEGAAPAAAATPEPKAAPTPQPKPKRTTAPAADAPPTVTMAQVMEQLNRATARDTLDLAADLIQYLPDSTERKDCVLRYRARAEEFNGPDRV